MEWSDIRVFLQVARSGQMAGASRLLNMDHSTISRRVARLEEAVGVSLFDRAGRRLTLTDEGARMLVAAERLEAVVIRDVLPIGEDRADVGGRVRIGTTEGFGSHYLAPRLPVLLEEHPGLEIELMALQRSFSLGMREADIVISLDRPDGGDVRVKKLCEARLHVYAHRDYFAERPRPTDMGELEGHLWCGYIDELLFTQELDMLTFGTTTVAPRYRTTSVTAQLGAALGGRALALLPAYMARGYPALEPVLADRAGAELTYWRSIHSDLARSPPRARGGGRDRQARRGGPRAIRDGPVTTGGRLRWRGRSVRSTIDSDRGFGRDGCMSLIPIEPEAARGAQRLQAGHH